MYFISKQEIKQLFGPNKSSTSGGASANCGAGVAGELPYCRSLCECCAKMFLPLVICLFAALDIHEATGQSAGIVQLNCRGKRMKSVAVPPLYQKKLDLLGKGLTRGECVMRGLNSLNHLRLK